MCVVGRQMCCDHLKRSVFTVYGCKETWGCCFCGKERQEMHDAVVNDLASEGEHGPFVPTPAVFHPAAI